ncbi:MAG: rRNA cytosine-C5-methyltransferase, partial [Bacteroidales bacterium]|nr:rRNA cytosine-C5-methyltransferase [Bacteroidales bacterium]
LSMSNALDNSSFPVLELKREEALTYLRKYPLSQDLFSGLPYGHILITYQNYPLGFVKNIVKRTNNLYPNEWRIRMNFDKNNLTE